jgi:DHA2 family multidrug resistance protein
MGLMAASLTAQGGALADADRLGEVRKLAIFLAMAVGMFMAVLDIQIVASSLGPLQAGLLAAADEVAWLQTAYLMAEIVMIPLSAFLAQALSTRWLFVLSAGAFTLASLACGLAWDLPSMVAFRAAQGFVGGAMIPLVFATGFAFFDGPRRAVATAVLGVVSTLAPTLGPSLGGWITDTLGWRWLFFINIAPGLLVTLALVGLGPVDRAQPKLLARIDWLHALSLAVFLGGLQFVLEEGPRRQWLDDPHVAAVAWFAAVAAAVFFERCWKSPAPLVNLAVFRTRGFTAAAALNFLVGFGLYAIIFLVPVFLDRVRGFTSYEVGATVAVAGGFMMLADPVAAWISTRADQRIVLALGLVAYATSFGMVAGVTKDWGFGELFWPQAVRGAASMFCIVPVVGLALGAFSDQELPDASGITNLMRNLGGAVGIALANTWLVRFFAQHLRGLGEGLSPDVVREQLAVAAGRLSGDLPDPVQALAAAQAALTRLVGLDALSLAFQDVFGLFAWVTLAGLVLIPFCRGGPLTSQGVH